MGHRLDQQQGTRGPYGYHTWLKVTMEIQPNEKANVIYSEVAIEADRGVRKLYSGKKGKASVP